MGRDRGDLHMDRGGPPMGGGGGMGLPMNLPPGVTPQLLNNLGITEGPITNQVFVANVRFTTLNCSFAHYLLSAQFTSYE